LPLPEVVLCTRQWLGSINLGICAAHCSSGFAIDLVNQRLATIALNVAGQYLLEDTHVELAVTIQSQDNSMNLPAPGSSSESTITNHQVLSGIFAFQRLHHKTEQPDKWLPCLIQAV